MGAELQQLVDTLASRLKRAVAIDDTSIRLLAYSSHEGAKIDPIRQHSIMMREVPPEIVQWIYAHGAGAAAGPFRLPTAVDIGFEVPRLGVPIRHAGIRLGFVWLLEGEIPLNDDEIDIVIEAADAAAVILHRDRLAQELSESRARELLRDLLAADDPAARAHASTLLVDGALFAAAEPVIALVITLATEDRSLTDKEHAVLELELDRAGHAVSARRHLSLVRHDHGFLLASEKDPAVRGEGIEGIGRGLVTALERDLPDSEPVVGIGIPATTLEEAFRSYEQAKQAADVARAVRLGTVTRFDRLGSYGMLGRIPAPERTSEILPAGVRHLLEMGEKGESFAATLEAYFDNACDVKRTADALKVHRATLYYRLERIQELTGIDLRSGEERLTAHLGLRLARMMGVFG